MAMQNRVIRSSNGREPGGTGNSRFALFIFLGSYALVFVTLAIVVINLRRVSFDWPPAGVPPLALWKGALVTLILLVSSLTLHVTLHAARQGNQPRAQRQIGRAHV